jgi:hypothetical protein
LNSFNFMSSGVRLSEFLGRHAIHYLRDVNHSAFNPMSLTI